MPIVSKPRPESLIDQSLKQESSLLTQTTTQEMHYQFKEEETKKKYLNPQEEEKYEGKRSLALLFIQRGFGITKAIDKGLPSIEIGRDQYRNLMGSIIANTFRRLESFLACELKLTIKYLDQEQMKNLHHRLLNCRVYLEPNVC